MEVVKGIKIGYTKYFMDYIEKLKETPLQIENFLSIESANKVYTLVDNYQNWIIDSFGDVRFLVVT